MPRIQPIDLPQMDSIMRLPDGGTETLVFQPVGEEVRAGTYTTRFVPTRSGDYRISLPIPDSAEDEVLQVEFSVEIPMFEQQRPERNDALLSRAADRTQGTYFVGMNSALEQGDQSRSQLEQKPGSQPSTNLSAWCQRSPLRPKTGHLAVDIQCDRIVFGMDHSPPSSPSLDRDKLDR